MSKPVEEMTREEVAAELARVRALKAEDTTTNGDTISATPLANGNGVPEPAAPAPEAAGKPAPWPHLTIEHGGLTLEVRKPDETALIAISMAGTPGIPPQTQMRIFTKFLMNHLSAESFIAAIEAMTDPESEIDISSMIQRMTKL